MNEGNLGIPIIVKLKKSSQRRWEIKNRERIKNLKYGFFLSLFFLNKLLCYIDPKYECKFLSENCINVCLTSLIL